MNQAHIAYLLERLGLTNSATYDSVLCALIERLLKLEDRVEDLERKVTNVSF